MILDQLILHNFGIYHGRHVIELTPTSKNKPIILFGGLNGSGKTTLLDALKLVLYGKLADCSNRRELSYEEFLRRCIHRAIDPQDGAALELRFRHRVDGVERIFRIHRAWSAKGRTVREHLEVLCDGKLDPVATENWTEMVEEFIPSRLSGFFFFDGEKIESLADLEGSADVLATALQSLLGLDLVDLLQTDLKVVERRNREKQRSQEDQNKLAAANTEVEQIKERYSEAVTTRGSKQNQVDRQKKRVRDLEEKFRRAGGELYTKRAEHEAARQTTADSLERTYDRLRELSESAAPLLLVRELLDEVAARSESPDSKLKEELLTVLSERDEKLLSEAKRAGTPSAVLTRLARYLTQDRENRKPVHSEGPSLRLTDEANRDLASLRGALLSEVQATGTVLLREVDSLQQELTRADRTLEMLPDEEAIGDLVRQLEEARKALAKAEAELQVAAEEVERLQLERSRKWDAYTKLVEHEVDDRFRQEEANRIIQHAQGVRSAMEQFRKKVAERHVRRIEQLILEGFSHLIRKDSLVTRLAIDPSTYHLSMFGRDDQPLPPERLSAGERQLLAISIIWGLARAAGRPLPVVIDTPLGRLDSVHRSHLVERYFPFASHQVILLSTDQEIDESGLERLKSSVCLSYRLAYDGQEQSSRVEKGYFWG
ncbi:MAG TPA: DNA sulfur modification protein DndD [Archangium sp.]|uniref:DNA sulfur modification protein DndD n=1 Tax=Archangium sp. TaxID=1872627 RepID=UPI002E31287C|nr:DNA sulfur modification protein DndD [Archangium sp.]HEX5747160.1 DNA sulfur modification protein DndD [Archangium sp.]